jgi:tRNA pseudouridine(38-40) synthase
LIRIAMGLEYDGTAFHGWQLQDEARTVQAVVEAAVARVADHPVRLHCAGRTDRGVHAEGQVIHFDTQARRSERSWVLGTNVNLPPDVAVSWGGPWTRPFTPVSAPSPAITVTVSCAGRPDHPWRVIGRSGCTRTWTWSA